MTRPWDNASPELQNVSLYDYIPDEAKRPMTEQEAADAIARKEQCRIALRRVIDDLRQGIPGFVERWNNARR